MRAGGIRTGAATLVLLALSTAAGCRSDDPFGFTPPPTSEERWKLLVLQARTEAEISAALGAAPESCEPLPGTPLVQCRWLRDFQKRTDAHVGEDGRMVMTQTEGFQVHVRCRLPTDGSPRALESCTTRLTF